MPQYPTKNIHVLMLAAGASTRLGQPKQLVKIGEATLLEHSLKTALSIENQGVTVVLGAYATEIKKAIEQLPVQIAINDNWQEGMGSTIACGMGLIPSDADAVLLLLCDQPAIHGGLLEKLIGKWMENSTKIIASAYGGSFGPPAIFGRSYFQELKMLQGQQGAKKLMERYKSENLLLIDFPEGAFDVDTVDDLALLNKSKTPEGEKTASQFNAPSSKKIEKTS
ncbi:MAG: nucleotidyltransferase family protein [Saprospiraceae bacterium]|nr:nucleotidyltransferase family protein [Saprospiraceae bacterium]